MCYRFFKYFINIFIILLFNEVVSKGRCVCVRGVEKGEERMKREVGLVKESWE